MILGEADECSVRNLVSRDGTINPHDWFHGSFNSRNQLIQDTYSSVQQFVAHEEDCSRKICCCEKDSEPQKPLFALTSLITLSGYGAPEDDPHACEVFERELPKLLAASLYDIHPVTTFVRLNRAYDQNKTTLSMYQADGSIKTKAFARSGYLFPRNRVTADLLNSVRLYTPKLFTSLESAEEIIGEASDSLANNSGYSAMGGIGGSVTDEEDTSTQYDDPILENEQVDFQTSQEAFKLTKIETHKRQVKALVRMYDRLFRDEILGRKKGV
jgi:hypothetical protein